MIKSVNLAKELVVTTGNKVGILADLSKLLADHGINIEGVAGYVTDKKEAKLMLVVNDTLRAKEAIQKKGYKDVKEHEVIVAELENKPGALKNMTAKLAQDNIDILYTYGTASEGNAPARIIFATNSNEKAFVLFKTS